MKAIRAARGSLALAAALIACSGCAALGVPSGPPPGEQAVKITQDIRLQRPPAASLTVDQPVTTFAEMLCKGYARIGVVNCLNYTFGCSEDSIKEDLLKESQQYGADVAWVAILKSKTVRGSSSAGGTYTSYSPSSLSYMGASGTGGYTTTTTFGPSYHNDEYPYLYGTAVLFAYDPELAPRQLKESRDRWESRAALVREARSVMLAKLSNLEATLRGFDVSVFKDDEAQRRAVDDASSIKTAILSGRYYSNFQAWDDFTAKVFYSKIYWQLDALKKASASDSGIMGWWEFKDSSVTEKKQIADLLSDAIQNARANEAALFDYVTLVLPEHLIFE